MCVINYYGGFFLDRSIQEDNRNRNKFDITAENRVDAVIKTHENVCKTVIFFNMYKFSTKSKAICVWFNTSFL